MKRKAIIFPYNAECAALIKNREMLVSYDIVACVSPKGYELHGKDAAYAYGGEDIGITVSCDDIGSLDYEDLLVCESASDFRQVVLPQIKIAAECGKNIVFMYGLEPEYCKEVEELCDTNHVKCTIITRRVVDASRIMQNERDILRISVPVIFVSSVIENTNKFDVQLGLRSYLLKEGYKVSQIGTKEYCELFGFHAIPQFMYDHQLSENDKIILFNRLCKSIELQEKPDVFIIGVPGATMVFNDAITNYFGIMAFEIANAVRPDTAIMCLPHEGIDADFLKMIQTSSKYKLDMQVDCFNMANKHFDTARSKDEKKLLFVTVNTKLVDKRVAELNKESFIPVYNSFNSESALSMYQYVVEQLSENDFETI
ncbi:TIGR04066 family peptide maturation system protein [Lachnospiraceae bacterium A4]|nr:TIGR04066 family peptide maturation system protein [Lachnospiraceae bacterium A4]